MNTIIAYILSIYTRVRHLVVLIRDDIYVRKHPEGLIGEAPRIVPIFDPELDALLAEEKAERNN